MIKLCECGCGELAPISSYSSATRGYVKNQPRRYIHGHNGANFKDGRTPMPEYRVYRHAKSRCSNLNDPDYFRYGGRGIQFRYTDFQQFLADIGRRPSPKYSIDRKDNNGHYQVGNCRWATASEQARNRRRPLTTT